MPDGAGINADVAAHQLPDVERLVVGRIHFDLDLRPLQVDEVCALAGGEYHVAVRRLDDAVVFDVGRDECDQAAAGGADHALVDDAAGARLLGEVEPACGKVGIRQTQRGNHQPADVDLSAGPEGDAVLVDQEHAPVGLQRAEDHAGAAAGDAVQDLAQGAGLDEAGDLALPDRESPPVDHRAVGVGHRQRIGGALEGGAADHHGRIQRIAQGDRGEGRGHGEGHPGQAEALSVGRRAAAACRGCDPLRQECPQTGFRRHRTTFHACACRGKSATYPRPSRNRGGRWFRCPARHGCRGRRWRR
jgi:hypothetical protein